MWQTILHFLSSPTFPESDEKTRRAKILSLILNLGMLTSILYIPFLLLTYGLVIPVYVNIFSALFFGVLKYFTFQGKIDLISRITVWSAWLLTMSAFLVNDTGIRSPAFTAALTVIVVVAGLLLSGRFARALIIITLSINTAVVIAEFQGIYISQVYIPRAETALFGQIIFFSVIAVILNITLTNLENALSDVRRLNVELERRVVERTAQLEDANKGLESFSYSVSHDLRAPLRAIDGFAGILDEDYGHLHDEAGKEHIQRIRENAVRMGQLIDELLEYSRMGRRTLRKQRIDPETLIQDVLKEIQPDLEGRRVGISVAALPSCEADPTLLRQVYANLIGNAVKYTRPRELGRIDVDSFIENGKTVYFVRDNGVGFNMEYADKLFGVFQRLHGQTEFEGTGVGLAMVAGIIKRHGGRIWAEAEVDQGATFYFTLKGKGD